MTENLEYRVVFPLSDFRRLSPQDRQGLIADLADLGYAITMETVNRWLSPFCANEPSLVVRNDDQRESVVAALARQGVPSRVDEFDVIEAA